MVYLHVAGTLLINERMLESYVIARDRFLVPNGKMFPTLGRCAHLQSLSPPMKCHLCSVEVYDNTCLFIR